MNAIIAKKPIDVDYSALAEEIETNPTVPKFKVFDKIMITKYTNILAKIIPMID